jgi:hypothetical protein
VLWRAYVRIAAIRRTSKVNKVPACDWHTIRVELSFESPHRGVEDSNLRSHGRPETARGRVLCGKGGPLPKSCTTKSASCDVTYCGHTMFLVFTVKLDPKSLLLVTVTVNDRTVIAQLAVSCDARPSASLFAGHARSPNCRSFSLLVLTVNKAEMQRAAHLYMMVTTPQVFQRGGRE